MAALRLPFAATAAPGESSGPKKRGTLMALGDFWQDVRYGLRALRKSPGFAAVAILTLSLGIGASSWLYNMMRQWVFDVVDFPQPSQIVVLEGVDTKKGWTFRPSTP